jgi:hypothetical protein
MILINCLAVAFLCLGMHIACAWDGMIFSNLCNWIYFRVPAWISKPFFACPYCMSSVYTVVYCLFTNDFNVLIIIKIPITCGMVAILMRVIRDIVSE